MLLYVMFHRQEQMSLCVRFTLNGVLREEFLKYVKVVDTTGISLSKVIMEEFSQLGLDCNYLIGQGYDGASVMSGHMHGVQAEIRKICPHAVYVHCAAHVLNLTLSKSTNVQSIRNCIGTIEEVATFING
jgi:hypothetical protein